MFWHTRLQKVLHPATATTFTSAPAAALAAEEQKPAGGAFDARLTPVPLPFDARSLKGLSEKLIQSHWANNYSGAVAALNTVRGRLSQALGDTNTPPYVYNGLKREQLLRTIGAGLGGGSGWVVLGYNEKLRLLENHWLADHSTNPPSTRPVLVMDMYEHAYHMDYGAAAARRL